MPAWWPARIERRSGWLGLTGANIESLAVGLNIDKALFTIATTGTKSAIANLVKQLSKLVKACCLPKIELVPRVRGLDAQPWSKPNGGGGNCV